MHSRNVKKEKTNPENKENIFKNFENFPDYKKVPCVLCGTLLRKGEKLKSREFKGENESIIHIMGCYACYGDKASKKRICPICRHNMSVKVYLIGRMTTKENGKKHLTVSGCSVCYK